MAAASLDAHPDSFDCGKCNLTKNCGVINVSCSMQNSLNQYEVRLKVRGLAPVRRYYAEGGGESYAKF